MKFKTISIILSFLSFNLKVLSVPLNSNDLKDISFKKSDKQEKTYDKVEFSEVEIYDTLSDDDIEIKITDTDVEEDIDSDFDEEISIPAIDSNECVSNECIETSKRILSYMDTSVNPCDDFYEFTCGGYTASNPEPTSSLVSLFYKIKDDMFDVLENNYKVDNKLSEKEKELDEKVFNKMKTIYTECKRSFNKDINKNEYIMNYINKFKINETLNQNDGLTTLLSELHNDNLDLIFKISAEKSDDLPYRIPKIRDNLDDYIIYSFNEVELSKKGLSYTGIFENEDEYNNYLKRYYQDINKYEEYIRNVLKIFYGSDENKVETIVKSIMDTKRKISQLKIDDNEYSSPIFHDTISNEFTTEIETMNYDNDDYDIIDNDEMETEIFLDEHNTDIGENYQTSDFRQKIETFNEKYPLINWKLYFEKRFEFYGIEIPVTDELLIEENNFNFAYKFLQEIDNKDLAIFIEWEIFRYFENFAYLDVFNNVLPDEYIKAINDYNKYINSGITDDDEMEMETNKIEENEEDEKIRIGYFPGEDEKSRCLDNVATLMTHVASRYYVKMEFPESLKSEAKNMVENIIKSMISRIQNVEWLDISTREYAIEKILKMKYIIGYSDYLINIENIYKYYKPLFNEDNYVSLLSGQEILEVKDTFESFYNENYVKNDIFNDIFSVYDGIKSNIKKDKSKFSSFSKAIPSNIMNTLNDNNDSNESYDRAMPTFDLNAYYDPHTNSMIFPASILQSPLFDVNQPDYLNYGSIGLAMGHELTHAFDKTGRLYDAKGKKINWWTDNDSEEFNEYSQCFIDQYSMYTFESENGGKENVNGEDTVGENVADNGGLDRTYEAWKLSIESNPEKAGKRNMKLPGLSDYSLEQLFFIAFGQTFCSTFPMYSYANNVHPADKFRVNGSVSNNKSFAKAFNCPNKSSMNPENKCHLW